MAILRTQHNKENPFVMINKYAIRNSDLSFKARGILCYLLEKPNNWRVYQSEVVKNTTERKYSVASCIKELKEISRRFRVCNWPLKHISTTFSTKETDSSSPLSNF